jgi:hypothetical protein
LPYSGGFRHSDVIEIALIVNGLAFFIDTQIYAQINGLVAKNTRYFVEGATHKYLLGRAKISIGAWRAGN